MRSRAEGHTLPIPIAKAAMNEELAISTPLFINTNLSAWPSAPRSAIHLKARRAGWETAPKPIAATAANNASPHIASIIFQSILYRFLI